MTGDRRTLTLASESISVTLTYDDSMPEIASIGPKIDRYEAAADSRPVPHAGLDNPLPMGLISEQSQGWTGSPGIVGARDDGTGWAPRFALTGVETAPDRASARFELTDSVAHLTLTVTVAVGDAVVISAALRNDGSNGYNVQRLASTVPLPSSFDEVLLLHGRWCKEFQTVRHRIDTQLMVDNREGRTSHTHLPAWCAGTPGFGYERGEVLAAQLAWSGNHTVVVDRTPDGRAYAQIAELLEPGELTLGPDESYTSPDLVVVWSANGLNGTSNAFHRYVRSQLAHTTPRPAILNTWEAVYFDHDLDTLRRLADRGAEVGVERFVLDDGWFGGRRDDTAGLGDWWVSPDVWPDGLHPIVDHVLELGMEFGLWVEPEMVNPNSDLYRAHPEWVLATDGYQQPLGRHQLILDFGRPEVRDYIFERLDALLAEYDIAYFKWDMNRPAVQGSHDGRAGVHGHTVGLYEVLDRIRAAHPAVEIESCSSGGGRTDIGVLRRTDRIWTSDCNDALERQQIHRGCSLLLPPEVMGAHLGPDRAHTTGRRQSIGFRGATALFGHFGIEWNLLDATDPELAQVAAIVGEYRRLRALAHAGDVYYVDQPDPAVDVHGVVAKDRQTALYAYVQREPSAWSVPLAMRAIGLDHDGQYRVRLLDSFQSWEGLGRRQPAWVDADGIVMSGGQLATTGIQPPIVMPESIVLFEITAEDAR